MVLRLISSRPAAPAPAEDYPFAETPLVVAFAAVDDLSHLGTAQRLPLAATPDVSADDAYLVLPLRARDALLRAFAKGQAGTVSAWFAEAWVVRAELDGGRAPRLWVGESWRVRDLLAAHEGAVVALREGDAVRAVNRLRGVSAVAPAGLLDGAGASAVMAVDGYVGVSRRGYAELGLGAHAVEPTFVWTEREGARVRVRVALTAADDDTVLALLAPVTLVA